MERNIDNILRINEYDSYKDSSELSGGVSRVEREVKGSPRDVVQFDFPSYRRYDVSDIYLLLGVFLVGFVFCAVLSNFYKIKREKIEQINQKF